MIATLVNSIAVLIGSLIGMLFHSKITERFKNTVYTGIGVVTIVIGIMFALETQRILFVAFSVVAGGLLGVWWNVEGGILRLGSFFERLFSSNSTESMDLEHGEVGGISSFAKGYLNASILFCVGAMTIVGSFRAGVDGQYDLIFTKSVMDGFMAILLAAAMGPGVAFSVITILIYQGGLTLAARWMRPVVSDLMLSELSGTGGILILMIGLNLLHLKEIKTGNFLPALLLIVLAVILEPLVVSLL